MITPTLFIFINPMYLKIQIVFYTTTTNTTPTTTTGTTTTGTIDTTTTSTTATTTTNITTANTTTTIIFLIFQPSQLKKFTQQQFE